MINSINIQKSFSPIKKKMVSSELYDQIVSMIGNRGLKPGDKLPAERDLAKHLNVSRQSIREALKKAEAQGLIEVRHGEGTFVRSMVSHWMEEPLVVLMTEEVGKVNEFLEIRKLLEVWCARKAAEVATARELKKLKKDLVEMEKALDSPETFGRLDFDFHLSIVAATHNTLMLHIFTSMKPVFEFKYKISSIVEEFQEKNTLLHQQHQELYEAISSRNADLAEQKIEAHLRFIEKAWIQDVRQYRAKQKA